MRPRARRALTVLALAWIATSALAQERSAPAPAEALTPAVPDDPALDRQVRGIAASLRCPVCYGLSVEDSPSELARDMKQTIRELLVAGRNPDQVRAYFVSRYGEWILLKPKAQGFNLVVWLLPVASLLAGLWVIWAAVRKWTGLPVAADPAGPEPGAPDDPDLPGRGHGDAQTEVREPGG